MHKTTKWLNLPFFSFLYTFSVEALVNTLPDNSHNIVPMLL